MIDAIYQYFWREGRLRAIIYSVTITLGVICASLASLVFHLPERPVSIGLIVFLLVSNLAVATIYALRVRSYKTRIGAVQLQGLDMRLWEVHSYTQFFLTRRFPGAEQVPQRSPRGLIAVGGLAACVVLIGASKLSVQIVQAAIVDPRMERAAASVRPDEAASLPSDQLKTRYQKISSIAATYTEGKIRANPEIVSKTVENLQATLKSTSPSEDARKAGVAAFVALVAYARFNNVLVAINVPTVLLPHGETGISLVSQVPLKNGAIWWQGSAEGNTIIASPSSPGPVFPISNSKVVFNAVNFDGFGIGRGFVGTDEESQVVVMNADITGAGQKLDSVVWLNIVFYGSKIIYNGGPLYLGNVTFVNCQFEFGSDSESQRVLAQITRAGGESVTLVSGL